MNVTLQSTPALNFCSNYYKFDLYSRVLSVILWGWFILIVTPFTLILPQFKLVKKFRLAWVMTIFLMKLLDLSFKVYLVLMSDEFRFVNRSQ